MKYKGIGCAAFAVVAVSFAINTWHARAFAGEPEVERPCIVVWHSPSRPLPGKPTIWGLELAIWKDGTILVAAGERKSPGQGILVGKVEPNDIETALQQISDAAFFAGWSSSIVVGGASTSIHVEHGGKVATVARTETLMPGVGVDVSASPKSRALVRMWRRTRGAIEAIAPIELARLDVQLGKQTSFRGYNVSDPVATSWRPR